MMKKALKGMLLGVISLSMLLMPAIALSQSVVMTSSNGETEIVVSNDEALSEKKEIFIRDRLLSEYITGATQKNEISPMSILCLFGHDMDTTRGDIITHNYYDSNPRCKVDYYSIEYCKRESCSYYSSTYLSSGRTSCH